MKRIILLFVTICITVSLCACSTSMSNNSVILNTENTTLTSSQPTEASQPDPKPTETVPLSTSFDLSLDDLVTVISSSQEIGDFVSYETPDFTIHREGFGTSGILCFSSPGSDKIEVAYFLAYADASRSSAQTKSAINAQKLLSAYCDRKSIDYIVNEKEVDDILVFSVEASDSELCGATLPFSVRAFRTPDEFLADTNRLNECNDLLLQCRYSDLYTYISDFIDSSPVSDNDIVYDLQAYAKDLVDASAKCDVMFDSLENESCVYYSGIVDISTKVNIVPYLTASSYGMSVNYKIGFTKNGWLFFDEITIGGQTVDAESFEFKSYHVNRVIVKGSTISEYVYSTLPNTILTSLAQSGIGTIRFTNTGTKESIDHTLTEAEISAILTLYEIRQLHRNFHDAIYLWCEA